ncbi:hypothetical protein [Actinokineospora inagensis]|uniref:hypothetical protein n=1 Tax=Actinokineospora inagensis TaxID=103730 RepID=UPI00047CB9E6|nr:hypothetical protein [Actinokineospora inagensis]
MTPESRLVLARYEDITAQYTARVDQVGEEFAAELARYDAAAAERDRAAAERLPAIDAAHEAAKQEAASRQVEEKPTTWTRENRPTLMSFGDDEDRPAPPPAPRPVPPVVAEEEQGAEQPRTRTRETRPAAWPTDDDQDDDWSGRSWVR